MENYYKTVQGIGVEAQHYVEGKSLTTFGSGGRVDCVAKPADIMEVIDLVSVLNGNHIPYRVLGGGSNVLISDEGYHGVLISLARLNTVAIKGGTVLCGAGAKCPLVAAEAMKKGLSGVEFLSHIPATFGGACRCNAAAFGQSVQSVLTDVTLLIDGNLQTVKASELKMQYHRADLPYGAIVLAARLNLVKTGVDKVLERTQSILIVRKATQPMERSAGSVFRKVGEVPAACFIERTGLKGMRIGGAELSNVHCNFVINAGGATTADFFSVAEKVRNAVRLQSGVQLEYEVERI